MTIVFTLCSNNYLAQAKTLGDSLLKHNPGYQFIIGLVDKKDPAIDYSFFAPHSIVPVETLQIPAFDALWQQYNIIEFNTAVKPSYFKWIRQHYPAATAIFYLDPDIYVYASFDNLLYLLQQHTLLLTPHLLTAPPLDNEGPGEQVFLNHGLYNLGFLGVSPASTDAQHILNWWEQRTHTRGYDRVAEGFFVDQLWMNLVPLYYPSTHVLRTYGYNAAPWNLHERRNITQTDGRYIMEDGSELVFYHFSSYKFHTPQRLTHNYSRYQFENCNAVVRQLYANYHEAVMANGYDKFAAIPCYYVEARRKYQEAMAPPPPSEHTSLAAWAKKMIKELIPPLLLKLWHK